MSPDPNAPPDRPIEWATVLRTLSLLHADTERCDAAACGLPVECVRAGCVERVEKCEGCETRKITKTT